MSLDRNSIVPIPSDNALQAVEYLVDNSPPTLSSFSLSLDTDILTLTFSESVLISSIDATSLTLIGNESIAESYIPLTGGIVTPFPATSSEGSVIIQIEFTQPDIVAIKANAVFGQSARSTNVRASPGLAMDTGFVLFSEEVIIGTGLLEADTVPAMLMSYNLDVNVGELMLTFSDVVDASTFRVEAVTIQHANYQPQCLLYSH